MNTSVLIAVVVVAAVLVLLLRGGGGSPELEAEVQRAAAAGASIIDVRTPGEFSGGHAPGARNVPLQALRGRLAEVGPKGAPVVVYCRSGNRSGQAARLLAAEGYTQVVDGRTVGLVTRALQAAPAEAQGGATNRAERRRAQRAERRAR